MQIIKYLAGFIRIKENIFFSIVLVMLIFSMNACKVDASYSIIPEILNPTYEIQKDMNNKDSLVVLGFAFTDGDGDIGLFERDSVPPNNVNLFVDYYEKESDGVFRKQPMPLSNDTINFNSRIAFQNQPAAGPLRGEVKLKVDVSFGQRDTLMFEYYIKDRALHKSNVLNSGIIIINR